MKYLLILGLLFLSFETQASRLIEVEDYYSAKTSDFIKTRYPRKAFTVLVKVDTDDRPQERQPSSENSKQSLNLPYLNPVGMDDVDFWERKDISLGTLISYLKSVSIKVDIDGDFAENEIELFKQELFQHLKLSSTYDRIDVNKRNWQTGFSWKNYGLYLVGALLGIGILGLLFFLIFQTGISKLVRGLSQPLAEIGRSAESAANSSRLLSSDQQTPFQMANQSWEEVNINSDDLKKTKSEVKKLSAYLSHPSAELIQKIEQLGARDPAAMGALFSEMEVEDLKKLITWAKGDWWRVAITQMTPLSKKSLHFIEEISHLRTRESLLNEKISTDTSELRKLLSRLTVKQFGALFSTEKFEKVEPFLRLLPQDTMIEVGKYLYPGQWAQLLEDKPTKKVENQQMINLKTRILEISPLKTEAEIANFFREADLIELLERSPTKDEREIYRVLSETSWVKQQRVPFYEIFQSSNEILEKVTSDLPLDLWALALLHCDRQECDKIYQFFTAKQKFILRELKSKISKQSLRDTDIVRAKKRILNSWFTLSRKETQSVKKEEINVATAA